jgi:hypothetical protein
VQIPIVEVVPAVLHVAYPFLHLDCLRASPDKHETTLLKSIRDAFRNLKAKWPRTHQTTSPKDTRLFVGRLLHHPPLFQAHYKTST